MLSGPPLPGEYPPVPLSEVVQILARPSLLVAAGNLLRLLPKFFGPMKMANGHLEPLSHRTLLSVDVAG